MSTAVYEKPFWKNFSDLYEVSQDPPIPTRTKSPAAMYAANLISFEAIEVYLGT